jgi:oxygen-dependent protoporphyrinogen oxidase
MNHLRVVIIGAGLSGLASALRLEESAKANGISLDLTLLERGPKPGGVTSTVDINGFLIEEGPDCFLTEKPAGMALVKRLGLDSQLIGTDPNIRQSFILKRNRLHPIPEGFYMMAPSRIMPLLTTPLLSPLGKLRAALEPFIPRRRDVQDESIGDFVTRRLGREALDYLAQPLVGGVYNADPYELSLSACTPQFKAMEQKYGSLLKAMAARRLHSQQRVSGARYSLFATFPKGMQTLVDAMVSRISSEAFWMSHAVQSLKPREGGSWEVATHDRSFEADAVVLAIQPNKMAAFLSPLDKEWEKLLDGIPAHDSATLNLGFRREDVGHPLDGYGFVVPSVEKKLYVGASFSSQKFPGRAPEGNVLIRVFLGKEGVSYYYSQGPDQLLESVLGELATVLQLKNHPLFEHLVVYAKSQSYFRPGHVSLAARLLEKAGETKGLYLAGNGLSGSGIPDCVAAGEAAADKIIQDFKNT